MKNYTVYFEIYGRKMKVKVLAESMTDAKEKVKAKITFYKVVPDDKDEFNKAMDLLDKIHNALNPKADGHT